jgi:hypothetical protein
MYSLSRAQLALWAPRVHDVLIRGCVSHVRGGHPPRGRRLPFDEETMPNKSIRAKIETANEQIAAAQDALDVALRELRVLPRNEKTIISKVVEDAVAGLGVAKTRLLELTALLAAADTAARANPRKK